MSGGQAHTEKWLVEEPTTIDLERIRALKVGLIGGQVDIVGHDEPYARVEVHSVSGKPLRIALDGDRLEVDHPQLRWDNWIESFKAFTGRARADVSIVVPRDVELKLGIVTAGALVSGLQSDASLSTVGGDLVVDGIAGDLQVNTVSGEVSIRNHYGRIDAHTVSGDITAAGELLAYSSDGVSGEVFLDITGVPDSIAVNTVSGAVTARLDADTATSYTISTVSGRIQLDDSEITGVRGRFTGRYGTLHRTWLELRVNSVSGNVSVLRRSPAPEAPAHETAASA